MGKLKASLYGTRDASMHWQEEVAKCMMHLGIKNLQIQSLFVPPPRQADAMLGPWRRLRVRGRQQRSDVVERSAEQKI